ncbi:7623_t:CDS:1, partial [Dentiscutata heterogama]
ILLEYLLNYDIDQHAILILCEKKVKHNREVNMQDALYEFSEEDLLEDKK